MKTSYKDISGQRFGDLTALKYLRIKGNHALWYCVCKCGKNCEIYGYRLRNGQRKHCGCQSKNITHGQTRGRKRGLTYATWIAMRQRCRDPNTVGWMIYGGRGIKVCDRWGNGEGGLSGYECFLSDMGPRPSKKHSIDRIDNDRGYEPGNCRWVDAKTQIKNRSIAVHHDVIAISKALGMTESAIYYRIRKGKDPWTGK